MEKVLHIVEIAPHVHAGYVNKRAVLEGELRNTSKGFKQDSIAVGGVAFLFNKIFEFGFEHKMVFVADRFPEKKRARDSEYKANRTGKPDVNKQMKIAEKVLIDCGFDVLFEEGYESDDIVWSLVQKYKSQYDKVYVHTGDSDLYVCIDTNVEILPASSRGKYVTRSNYEVTVTRDAITPYNSISFSKVLYGETGDNIPALPKELRERMRRAFFTDFYYEKMGDKAFMRAMVEAMFPEALLNFDTVYPEDVECEIDPFSYPDHMKTQVWGYLLKSKYFKTRIEVIPQSVTQIIKELFAEGSEFIDD